MRVVAHRRSSSSRISTSQIQVVRPLWNGRAGRVDRAVEHRAQEARAVRAGPSRACPARATPTNVPIEASDSAIDANTPPCTSPNGCFSSALTGTVAVIDPSSLTETSCIPISASNVGSGWGRARRSRRGTIVRATCGRRKRVGRTLPSSRLQSSERARDASPRPARCPPADPRAGSRLRGPCGDAAARRSGGAPARARRRRRARSGRAAGSTARRRHARARRRLPARPAGRRRADRHVRRARRIAGRLPLGAGAARSARGRRDRGAAGGARVRDGRRHERQRRRGDRADAGGRRRRARPRSGRSAGRDPYSPRPSSHRDTGGPPPPAPTADGPSAPAAGPSGPGPPASAARSSSAAPRCSRSCCAIVLIGGDDSPSSAGSTSSAQTQTTRTRLRPRRPPPTARHRREPSAARSSERRRAVAEHSAQRSCSRPPNGRRLMAVEVARLPGNGAQDIYAIWLARDCGEQVPRLRPEQVRANGTLHRQLPAGERPRPVRLHDGARHDRGHDRRADHAGDRRRQRSAQSGRLSAPSPQPTTA